MRRANLFSLLFILFTQSISAQDITIQNPGFEDIPRHSHTPVGWTNCGPPTESAPDIHPDYRINEFEVTKEAFSGRTYLGMVVRANDTWESVGTQLSEPLIQGECYSFSIYLARSPSYLSGIDPSNPDDKVNFITPAILRIWGGRGYCGKRELLAASTIIEHENWQEYAFLIQPQNFDVSHIVLEAFYETPALFPYSGNILLDEASSFQLIEGDCDVQSFDQSHVQTKTGTVDPKYIDITERREVGSSIKLPIDDPSQRVYKAVRPRIIRFEGELRSLLAESLNELTFTDVGLLERTGYYFESRDNWEIGHPSAYQLSEVFRQRKTINWELVVFEADEEVQKLKINELTIQFFKYDLQNLTIRLYDAEQDEGQEWYGMSVGNGLYLLRS